MEAAPPTYEASTMISHWDLVARYIPSSDLCSAALVCESWHATFVPHLWGNPASHFGIENDRVYVALTKFKHTLRFARLLVRSLTHTLHLPPAHAEIYNGPQADWLRDILERLPNLQSLIVRGLPFFDHSALWALKYKPPKPRIDDGTTGEAIELPGSSGLSFQRPIDTIPSFGLRLIDASRCPNVTSSSLAQALGRFEALIYLDLSFTYPARDSVVLNTLRRFTGLQVLKMRGNSLSDDHLQILASTIARRVRSLDIRDNLITDRGIRTLLDKCFTAAEPASINGRSGQRSPALMPYMGSEMLDIYQGADFESFLRNAFTGRFIARLAIEDAPEGGLTHLYIGGNNLTVEGVSGLLRSERLHVLDVDTISAGEGRSLSISGREDTTSQMTVPGIEKLTPIVSKHAAESTTFLRIEHVLVTKDAPSSLKDEIIQGRAELGDTALPPLPTSAAELDATSFRPEAFELPTVQTPKYELPGDPMQFVVTPAANGSQHRDVMDEPPNGGPRRGSAFAPEVIDSLAADTDRLELLSPVSPAGEETLMAGGLMSPLSPVGTPSPEFSLSPLEWPISKRPRTYSSVADERNARLNAHKATKHNLHPAMLPHLRTLVLTNVPPTSSSEEVSDRLVCFIRQCAEEAYLAHSHAKLDYSLPPGRRGHASALRHSADKVFALKKLVLELAPEGSTRRSSKASPWQHNTTKSMTDDRDSEALWSAAETDFSFFGDEEISFPSLDYGRYANTRGDGGKEVCFNSPSSSGQTAQPKVIAKTRFDTVSLISTFRKERKQAHQRSIAAGSIDPETEGYWEGVVQVVRPGSGMRRDEEIDYYGNRFENGYLYR